MKKNRQNKMTVPAFNHILSFISYIYNFGNVHIFHFVPIDMEENRIVEYSKQTHNFKIHRISREATIFSLIL